jgi:DNA modification methylase
MPDTTLYVGDALEVLRGLAPETIQTCVTSPPYWGLRDYGVDGQIGQEPTPDAYAETLVGVFREVRRVLRDDGTVWLNLGDSYAANRSYQVSDGKHQSHDYGGSNAMKVPGGLKPKDLVGIPWRVALALQADGWYLRSDIIWAKGNPMPESVKDRPTCSHEHVFLLSKSKRYFYDNEAIKEPLACPDAADGTRVFGGKQGPRNAKHGERTSGRTYSETPSGRNKRDVWQINTRPFPGAHFAVYPPDLVEPCILAGTSERGECRQCGAPVQRTSERVPVEPISHNGSDFHRGKTAVHHEGRASRKPRTQLTPNGWDRACECDGEIGPQVVLDPFSGAGTTGLVAMARGRDYVGIELNEEYATMAAERIRDNAPLINRVTVMKDAEVLYD